MIKGRSGALAKEFKGLSVSDREEDERLYEGKLGGHYYDMEMDGDEDMICCGEGGSDEDNEFDNTVGVLEEIIMDPKFVNLQNNFCRQHCTIFEDTEENKLEYTGIFNEYTDVIEGYLEKRLKKRIPGFELDKFAHMCEKRKDEITGDVFDILLSCGDFSEFKFLMLSHKSAMRGSPLFVPSFHASQQQGIAMALH
mmetsp:Transcript_6614/g.10426  ORF Transcript_6614/g.10426 Transcript_6614/m.10426 type:complete len:196 (+) Transcript_6614:157-744(+)